MLTWGPVSWISRASHSLQRALSGSLATAATAENALWPNINPRLQALQQQQAIAFSRHRDNGRLPLHAYRSILEIVIVDTQFDYTIPSNPSIIKRGWHFSNSGARIAHSVCYRSGHAWLKSRKSLPGPGPWTVWRESRATTACSCYFPEMLIAAVEFPLRAHY